MSLGSDCYIDELCNWAIYDAAAKMTVNELVIELEQRGIKEDEFSLMIKNIIEQYKNNKRLSAKQVNALCAYYKKTTGRNIVIIG